MLLLVQSTQRFERYLAREFDAILHEVLTEFQLSTSQTQQAPRIPFHEYPEYLRDRIYRVNGLVDTLNDLMAGLFKNQASADSHTTPQVFHHYPYVYGGDVGTSDSGTSGQATQEQLAFDFGSMGYNSASMQPATTDITQDLAQCLAQWVKAPAWKRERYANHAEWVLNKELERGTLQHDLDVSVSGELGQYRADEALKEYSEKSGHDIAQFDPENERPVDAIGALSRDISYVNHTVNRERIDGNPTQIAVVETAVEHERVDSNGHAVIDASYFSPEKPVEHIRSGYVSDALLSRHIPMYSGSSLDARLSVGREPEVVESKEHEPEAFVSDDTSVSMQDVPSSYESQDVLDSEPYSESDEPYSESQDDLDGEQAYMEMQDAEMSDSDIQDIADVMTGQELDVADGADDTPDGHEHEDTTYVNDDTDEDTNEDTNDDEEK